MKTRGILKSIELPFRAKYPVVTFEVFSDPALIEKYQEYDLLDIEFDKHREHRSNRANRMLWGCLGIMADALKTDNWSMYLYELQRYGKYTYVEIIPEAVKDMQKQWRETKVVGERKLYDSATGRYQTMVEMLCFFGSHTYNSKEFSRLLDGVISDMKDMHLPVPPTEEMRRAIAEIEEKESGETEEI